MAARPRDQGWSVREAAGEAFGKIGGAAAVRTKLVPFFIGVFLASVCAHALFIAINAYLYFFHYGALRPGGTF